jgi:Doubled CXXCH motif (Paired_CXXCH_1)
MRARANTAWWWLRWAMLMSAALVLATPMFAQRISDVKGTRHNLSTGGQGSTRAAPGATTEVCVFCHTPHGASQQDQGGLALRAPLWNRRVPDGATYTPYTSASLDAQTIVDGLNAQPGGSSKLCLSCHDGTLAIGNVNVLNGKVNASIPMTGTGPGGTMPPGEGVQSGFTRFLGTDLRNDHPISLTYNSALAARDGELRAVDGAQRWPAGSGSVIGLRSPGFKPLLPLEPTGNNGAGQVQCATCHDPHLRELDATKGNQKFLRMQRFQESAPSGVFNQATDSTCLACHDKNLGLGIWAYSAHARPDVADETYRDAAATLREFPAALPVWKASCLNCHDTHTVQGARRLTREGTDAPLPASNPLAAKQGGNPAMEKTCYQCHTSAAKSVLNAVIQVPNIESEFDLLIRMPITTAEQGGTTEEVHDIGGNFSDSSVNCTGPSNRCGADFIESKRLLAQRHAECTDCHNPHRVMKFRSFTGGAGGIAGAPDPAGTHRHEETPGYTHTNIASGVLRGTWGVEPNYGSTSFQNLPSGYTVKRGDPGASINTEVVAPYVTREYQVCLKCHSDHGYTDNNVYPFGSRPALGRSGGTAAGSNNLTVYTNQAKEFQAPVSHRGDGTGPNSGSGSNYSVNNHRSWHPVIDSTGRSAPSPSAFRPPWGNAIGSQTMYCSDCHGSNTADNSVVPPGGENGTPWGPHGSNNNFLLNGVWNSSVGANNRGDNGPNPNGLCFKCHNPNTYANRNGQGSTGFSNSDKGNLHAFHTDKVESIRCNWCHVAVPHGWKNKALLVNLNDVGPEAGRAGNEEWRMNAGSQAYNQEPYYLNAKLKVRTFATSGNWVESNCGSNNSAAAFGANGNNTNNGKAWMEAVCKNPP